MSCSFSSSSSTASSSASSSPSPSAPPSTHRRDPHYGYGPISSLSTSVIKSLFPPSLTSADPFVATDSRQTQMPALIEFIAYALYRTRLPDSIVYSALLLLTRLKQLYPAARGTASSPHRLFLSSLMLASKMSMDDTYSNKSWVIVGQNLFSLHEVNRMERELFGFLNSNCYITKAELQTWCQEWCDESESDEVRQPHQPSLSTRSRSSSVPQPASIPTGYQSSNSNSPISSSATTTSSSSSSSSSPPYTPDIIVPTYTNTSSYNKIPWASQSTQPLPRRLNPNHVSSITR